MEKHTPGPWEAVKMRLGADKDRRPGFVVNGPEENIDMPIRVCDIRCSSDLSLAEAHANARLIAAAPEMLQALHDCITAEGSHAVGSGDVERLLRRLREIDRVARAAIAKAKGE